jgi:arginyl-tRNA synthetase
MISYLTKIFSGVLNNLDYPDFPLIFDRPNDDKFGDLSTNVAMIIAKQRKTNPREVASQIINSLQPDDIISKYEIAGPGFINIFLNEKYILNNLQIILDKKNNYGKLDINKNKTANIEWVSANPTGPLHAGHGRHIALGKAVANLLEWSGYNVTREYYYNNAGKQMENLASSVYARYMQLFDESFQLPEDAYIGEYIIDIAKKIKEEYGDKLINSSDLNLFKKAGENYCFDAIKQTLHKLGIVHKVFFNEDTLYKKGSIEQVLNEFNSKELSYKNEGATWLKLSDLQFEHDGNKIKFDKDKVLVKSSGEPTYRLPDIAYHIDKLSREYDFLVDIFGSDHSNTYTEVLAGLYLLGYDISKIKVIIHQMVTFVQDGKPVKMSKRSDNVYYLDDLLDDVGVDVAQFFFVMRSANTHLDFDIKLAKEQSDKNPVFYLQYAHARICGILRNAETLFSGYDFKTFDISLISNPDEINLLKKLLFFPYYVASAYNTLEPHKIILYLNELAESFHRFYHNNRVINTDNKPLSLSRLALCKAAQITLANGFSIIGISAPERM